MQVKHYASLKKLKQSMIQNGRSISNYCIEQICEYELVVQIGNS